MKDYLQPIATLFVAIGLGFIAVDHYRTSNARFNCAQVFGSSEGAEKDLARLGLPKDGNNNNIRGYYRAFINPENSIGSGSFPSSIDVNITDIPLVAIGQTYPLEVKSKTSGSIAIRGSIDARTCNMCGN